MKAAVVHSAGIIRWEDVPDPEIPYGWVRVKIKAVGICSSDIGRALDGSAYHYPIVLGHEMAGVVVEAGEGADPSLVGLRVAVTPLIPCGKCEWCSLGRYSMCDDYDYLGSRRDGGCAEYVVAPVANLIPIPDSVSFDSASVLEPASVVLHGMNRRVEAGDDVLILGAGNLGMFGIQHARILGATRIFVLDLSTSRLKIAESLGAIPIQSGPKTDGHAEIMKETRDRGVDIVVDTCGVAAVQASAIGMARKGGRIVYIGLPKQDVILSPKLFNRLVRCEQELYGSWNSFSAPYPGNAWTANVAYMATGQLKTDQIITHRIPLSQSLQAYQMLREGKEPMIKGVLYPDEN
jgi:L-iditol 2-dehydrogenase